jgi:hypothetical protein
VLARVVVIALGAVLLLLTVALFVQVGAGPRQHAGDLGSASAAAPTAPSSSEGAGPSAVADSSGSAPAPADSAPIPPAARAIGGRFDPTSNDPYLNSPAAAAMAASLQFDEANKLYDRRDYEEARTLALHLLRQHDTSVRMRRIVVATSCIMGDQDLAQQHYLFLPAKDRGDMRERCTPYGLTFREE